MLESVGALPAPAALPQPPTPILPILRGEAVTPITELPVNSGQRGQQIIPLTLTGNQVSTTNSGSSGQAIFGTALNGQSTGSNSFGSQNTAQFSSGSSQNNQSNINNMNGQTTASSVSFPSTTTFYNNQQIQQNQLDQQNLQNQQNLLYQQNQQNLLNQQSQQNQQAQIQSQTTSQAQLQQLYFDANCATFIPGTNRCLRCSTRYYLSNQTGLCTAISGQCSSYDNNTGVCLGCYSGFLFLNGECYLQISGTASADANCKVPSASGTSCQSCYQGYYVSNGICTASNPLCATIDINGNCLSCYSGYVLYLSSCVMSGVANVPPNCANFTNGVCVQCAQGSFWRNGNCVSVSPLCRTYDNSTGYCTSCYNGYVLNQITCSIAPPSSGAANCKNFTNGICVQCSQGYLMLGGVCQQINPLCQTVNNNNGLCTSCYKGYDLSLTGQCVVAAVNPAAANCRNWTNNICY